MCTSHTPYIILCTVRVLLLRAMPRTLDPDVDTPRVNVDQQGEKRHKNVSSGRLTHHVVLFYYGSIATASHPSHAKCKILQTVSVQPGSTTGFCPFSLSPTLFCCKHTLHNFNPVGCLTGSVRLWASVRHHVLPICATAWFKPCRV
jgi:hypothetical protein